MSPPGTPDCPTPLLYMKTSFIYKFFVLIKVKQNFLRKVFKIAKYSFKYAGMPEWPNGTGLGSIA